MAEAEIEAGNEDQLDGLLDLVRKLHADFIRDDMPLFPSNIDEHRADWSPHFAVTWAMIAARIYPVLSRIWPKSSKQQHEGMQVLYRHAEDQSWRRRRHIWIFISRTSTKSRKSCYSSHFI